MFSNMLMSNKAAAPAGGWTPATVATNWFDFSSPASMFQDASKTTPVTAGGQPIGAAANQVSGGLDITQTTSTVKPTYTAGIINGLGGAVFAGGVNGLLSAAVGAIPKLDIYFVLRLDTQLSGNYLTQSKSFGGNTNNGSIRMAYWGAGDISVSAGGVTPHFIYGLGVFYVLRQRFDGVNVTAEQAGVLKTTLAYTGGIHDINIGHATGSGAFSLSEFITCPNLSAADNTNMLGYFNGKYGI